MANGNLLFWNAALILDGNPNALVSIVKRPSPVQAMEFSSLDVFHLCAIGNGHMCCIDCGSNSSSKPSVTWDPPTPKSEFTALAWNPAVAHIVATATAEGTVHVWDVSQQKQWCELRGETAVGDVAWNPSQGLHLLTASARTPTMHVWNLGGSFTVPHMTLTGHAAGIMGAAWCPHDDTYMVTVAKDNRTFVWDLEAVAAVAEIPNDTEESAKPTTTTANDLFSSGGLSEQTQVRYEIKWSPFQRGIALVASMDRKVQIHSISTLPLQRPPAWFRPGPPVSMGFGGMLLSLYGDTRHVTVQTVSEEPELVQTSLAHEMDAVYTPPMEFCQKQQERATSKDDKAMWGFMQVVLDPNSRQELLKHLGFDAEAIAAASTTPTENGDLLANGDAAAKTTTVHENPAALASVKKALIVGNFEAAVDSCFKAGNYGDALLVASCAGGDLWSTTQERYFSTEAAKRPFLSLLSGIVCNQMTEVVAEADLSSWQETLAVLSTYAQSEEFPSLVSSLADRLRESGDTRNASLCYLCALDLEGAMSYWKDLLTSRVETDYTSLPDLLELHDFIAKVSTFTQAAGPGLTPEIEELYTKYAKSLADQGLLCTASKYCAGNSTTATVLRDRLYRSRASQRCYAVLGAAPDFPYQMVAVEASRGMVLAQPKTAEGAAEQQTEPAALDYSQNSHQQQQQDYAEATSYPASAAATSNELPPDWMEIQDPSSGQMYYANQVTGEVTWDRPQAAPAPAPVAHQSSFANHDTAMDASQQSHVSVQSNVSARAAAPVAAPQKSSLASKYGDGFVSSASNPELAYQYGNVGTSNPYGGASRPGPAATPVESSAPISGSLNFDSLTLSQNDIAIKDTLLGLAEALKAAPLNPVEKRQVGEGEKGVAILVKKLGLGGLSDSIVQQVSDLAYAVSQRDVATAASIQTKLANSEWREHKDWLKGIKILVQLATKKL